MILTEKHNYLPPKKNRNFHHLQCHCQIHHLWASLLHASTRISFPFGLSSHPSERPQMPFPCVLLCGWGAGGTASLAGCPFCLETAELHQHTALSRAWGPALLPNAPQPDWWKPSVKWASSITNAFIETSLQQVRGYFLIFLGKMVTRLLFSFNWKEKWATLSS